MFARICVSYDMHAHVRCVAQESTKIDAKKARRLLLEKE